MFSVNIDFKNLPEAVDMLAKYPEVSDENIAEVFKLVLPEVLRRSKELAPVDTGRLRADIKVDFNRRELEGKIYNEVEYAIYVHEGTRFMKSRPYIRNALFNYARFQAKRELERNFLKAKRGLL